MNKHTICVDLDQLFYLYHLFKFLLEEENKADMHWEFTDDNRLRADGIIAQYPEGHQQAAAIPLLDLGMLLEKFTFIF